MKNLNMKDSEYGYVHAVSGPGKIFFSNLSISYYTTLMTSVEWFLTTVLWPEGWKEIFLFYWLLAKIFLRKGETFSSI